MAYTPSYTNPDGLTSVQLTEILQDVFKNYPEYWQIGFTNMVHKFADDPFYKHHLVAGELRKCPFFELFV